MGIGIVAASDPAVPHGNFTSARNEKARADRSVAGFFVGKLSIEASPTQARGAREPIGLRQGLIFSACYWPKADARPPRP